MSVRKLVVLLCGASLLFLVSVGADAAVPCGNYTNTLMNGTTADANQVMQNFNDIRGCANSNLAPLATPTFTGNVGIGASVGMLPYGLYLFGSGNSYLKSVVENTNNGSAVYVSHELLSNTTSIALRAYGSGFNTFSHSGIALAGWAEFDAEPQVGQNVAGFLIGLASNAPMVFSTNSTERMRITGAGSVAINQTTAGSTLLFVNGTAGGTSGYQNLSDERLKKNVQPIAGALGLVQRLRPVRFDWRSPSERQVGKSLSLPLTEHEVGFVAQEVEAVVPEAVAAPKKGSNDLYGLKESDLVPILTAAIKEQQSEIEQLRAEVAALKARK